MVRVDGPDGPPWLLPTRAREGVVGLHDLLHELVPNDVFLVEVDEADPLDVLDDLQRFHEPRLPWMWQVDLCDVTSDDRLGTESETGQEHLHLLGRGVLCLVEDDEGVVQLSLIHISEPTRLLSISYAVFCLKKKKKKI